MSCTGKKSLAARRRAKNLDLLIEQGATSDLVIIYKEDGVPVSLDGATVHAQFRERISSPTALIDLSVGDGFSLVPAEGKILMVIAPAKTKDLKIFSGVWDMLITFADGSKFRLLKGKWELDRGVTR